MPSMPSFDPEQFLGRRSARPSGRCCRQTTTCRCSIRRWRAFTRRVRRSSRRMALALLNAGVDRKQIVNCTGAFPLGNHVFHCDKRHGPLDMDGAVVHSCDVYFYTMCLRVGAEKLVADGPLDGLRREVRPALRQPALRHHPRPRMDDAQISSQMAGIRHGQHVDRPGHGAHQPAPARRHGQPPRDRKTRRSAPAQEQAGRAADRSLRSARTISTSSARRCGAWSIMAPPPPPSSRFDGIQMAGKTGTAQTHNLSAGERGNYTSATWKLRDHSLFMAFAAVRQPALRGGDDRRAWRLRRRCRSAAGPRHAHLSVRQAKGARARSTRSSKASAARSTSGSRARPPPGAQPTASRPSPPSRHDHLGHHPPAARAAAVALDLPRRGDRAVRPGRALFGRGRLGRALGGQAGHRLPRSSCASRSACRG